MHTQKLLLAVLLGTALLPVLAQDKAGPANRPITIQYNGVHMDGAENRMVVHPAARHVKNAPYSAEVINETQQNLADGNQITSKTSSMTYRDSAGRTRNEVHNPKGELRMVHISDPVEGTNYMLNPVTKIASKFTRRPEVAHEALAKAREKIAEIQRREGKSGHAEVRERVEVRVLSNVDGQPMPGVALRERLGPVITGAFGDMKWSAKATTRELGSKDIEGVKAEGKVRSYDIPAGEVGNRNAIVVSDEIWYSPELQVPLLTKHSDPRSGDRIYRLDNIKREEPAASLFVVPSDYTVKDATPGALKLPEPK